MTKDQVKNDNKAISVTYNEANKRYEQALDDVLASLKKIDETQSQANDQIDIAATQQQISEME